MRAERKFIFFVSDFFSFAAASHQNREIRSTSTHTKDEKKIKERKR